MTGREGGCGGNAPAGQRERTRMKFFIDTADIKEIRDLAETGLVAKPLAQKIARGVAHIIAELGATGRGSKFQSLRVLAALKRIGKPGQRGRDCGGHDHGWIVRAGGRLDRKSTR